MSAVKRKPTVNSELTNNKFVNIIGGHRWPKKTMDCVDTDNRLTAKKIPMIDTIIQTSRTFNRWIDIISVNHDR